MILDTRTLVLVISIQFFVMGICVLFTARKNYSHSVQQSIRLWGLACLIHAVGWLLGGFRGFIPDFLSVVIANSLIFAAQLAIYQSLRIFDGQPPIKRFLPFVVTLVLAIFWITLQYSNSILARMTVTAAVSVIPFLICGYHLISPRQVKPGIIRYIQAFGFGLLAVIYTGRIYITLNTGASIVPPLANTPLQTIVFGGTALGVMIMSVGFLLMCTESFNAALLRLAVTDELTGLYNRRELKRLVCEAIESAKDSNQSLAFLLLDANDFKIINDRYGHLAGDAALQMIANTIKSNLRQSEIVGRLGGDEFVVVLPNTSVNVAKLVAERLVAAVNDALIYFDGNRIKVGVSYGTAMLTAGEQDFAQLVHAADKLLYEMKPGHKKERLVIEGWDQI